MQTAQWYKWEREMQHAVDQAAYAGAWARPSAESENDYATHARPEYDANMEKVVVVSAATRSLPFTSFFTGSQITIRVSAQAIFKEGANDSACLVTACDTVFAPGLTLK